MITFSVDGKTVRATEGQSILDAALGAGIYIPHLCAHPDLAPQGACGLCCVQLESGEVVKSCMAAPEEGMLVTTNTGELMRMRRISMELMLAGHPDDCTSCRSYLKCELQALMQYLTVTASRMHPVLKKNTQLNNKNPLIIRDMQRCVQCGRCVRVCRDVRGVGVLDFRKKGGEVYIGTEDDRSLAEAGCRFCSACVEVCPTGALLDREGVFDETVPRAQALVPCQNGCPAHVDIPRYLRSIAAGDVETANAVIRETLTFPGTLGAVCSHRCETDCKRDRLNEAVSICRLKGYAVREAGEDWKARRTIKKDTGKTVAVVGAGPTGLTAAYYLRKQGHAVTVFEAREEAGGQLRFALPEFRLPKDLVKKEIADLLEIGIEIRYCAPVEDPMALAAEYDAVLLAVGCTDGVKLPIPGADAQGVCTALQFMGAVNRCEHPAVGRRCFVIGGGSVGFDTARTLIRMGAESVSLACVEDARSMKASADEISRAEEEGVRVYPGKNFLRIAEENGRAVGVQVNDIEEFAFDANGCLRLTTVEGSEQLFPADMVVFAVGQRTAAFSPDAELERGRANSLVLERQGSHRVKGCGNLFAAGDAATGMRFVIDAIAGGRSAAGEIDIFLGGDGNISEALTGPTAPDGMLGLQEGFAGRSRETVALRDVRERIRDMLPAEEAMTCYDACCEAGRCLQCDLRKAIHTPEKWTAFSGRQEART